MIEWLRTWGRRAPQIAGAYTYFRTDPGMGVLRDLAAYASVNTSSFAPGDPHQTAFNEGRRDVYNHICAMAGLKPAEVMQAFQQEPDA